MRRRHGSDGDPTADKTVSINGDVEAMNIDPSSISPSCAIPAMPPPAPMSRPPAGVVSRTRRRDGNPDPAGRDAGVCVRRRDGGFRDCRWLSRGDAADTDSIVYCATNRRVGNIIAIARREVAHWRHCSVVIITRIRPDIIITRHRPRENAATTSKIRQYRRRRPRYQLTLRCALGHLSPPREPLWAIGYLHAAIMFLSDRADRRRFSRPEEGPGSWSPSLTIDRTA